MDQLISALQFLIQKRIYLAAFAVLAAILFVLRNLGAAAEIELKYVLPTYLVGGFCALVLIAQTIGDIPGMIAARNRVRANLATLSLHHRAILAYIKAQGQHTFYTENYATLRQMIPLGLVASNETRGPDEADHATFTVPMQVWRAINAPDWISGPTPTSPPWTPEWIGEYLIPRRGPYF